MANGGRQLFCRVITPQRMVFDGQADRVVVRISDGELGVLADHAPVVSTVVPWDVRILQGDETTVFATSYGFFRVADNLVQILVEEAQAAEEIDIDQAEHQVEQAERELSEISEAAEDEEDVDRIREDIERRRRIGENFARVAREYREDS